MKKAVHFGAGNIGRGFIGVLLHQAGYEVVFADVVDALVDEMNAAKSYRVHTLDEVVQAEQVDNIRAVRLDSPNCIQEMVDADLITTAVGVGNLPNVGQIIAEALKLRRDGQPHRALNIMACENAIRATSTLKQEILRHVDADLADWVEQEVGFADVAVDRIAPNRAGYATEPLDAVVERFFEWDIEEPALKGALVIPGATFVAQLDPYLARKLYMLNGAHATAAYAGYQKGCETVLAAMQDSEIAALVAEVQHEAMMGLLHRYPQFEQPALEAYAERVRERFLNPHIHDDVARVGRDPLRKLSAQDRLVGPLLLAKAAGAATEGLASAIALGLAYDNAADAAAVQLQQDIAEHGVTATITRVTGLTEETIVQEIAQMYEKYASA